MLGGLFNRFRAGPGAPGFARPVQHSWIVAAEQTMLRVVSFGFSAASAYAIARVWAPPGADGVRQAIGIVIAGGFAVTGFFLSRNIAYRLMDGEVIWAYLPVCLVVEVVEVFCNYLAGVSDLRLDVLLQGIPASQHAFLTTVAYVVVSSIPAMTIFLSVADADFERRKVGAKSVPSKATPFRGGMAPLPQRQPVREQRATWQSQPRQDQNGAVRDPMQGVQ